ncbi:hypothetical protein F4778DRAFT_343827 [Xylariomycetidae sp. FL2044]|nr:hypothetical protein F4778DRAFT_343827 [Xylariomycetidae sp. FL2044]
MPSTKCQAVFQPFLNLKDGRTQTRSLSKEPSGKRSQTLLSTCTDSPPTDSTCPGSRSYQIATRGSEVLGGLYSVDTRLDRSSTMPSILHLAVGVFLLLVRVARAGTPLEESILPSYHYGASIPVECMNRSIETGEHIQDAKDEIQWIPFPVCNETSKPLEFHYGIEAEVNCTIPMVDDPFFHLLEFYIHSDAPLACRLPARPPSHVEIIGEKQPEQEFIPLVFALAGTLQQSHMHISTHLNVLLHSTPKHHIHKHDSGVLDSGAAYSTSPLSHMAGSFTRKLIIGDPLPLSFSIRWFPTPALPKTEGKVEWQGMGGHIYASTVFYGLVSFIAGVLASGVYFFGNGWGYSKRID